MDRASNKKKSTPPIERVRTSMSVWTAILQQINPIGAAAECYSRTLAYKIESRKLDLEEQRILAQADCTMRSIESGYQLKMEELRQRQLLIQETFGISKETMQLRHVEKMTILECVPAVKAAAQDTSLDEDARSKALDLLGELTRQLVGLGDQDVEVVRSLTTAIPPVDATLRIAGPSDGSLMEGI